MTPKIYVWNWRARESQYGEFYTLSLKLSELEMYVNEKWYVSLVVNRRKTPDQYGNDLSVAINDYKPKEKNDVFDTIPKEKNSDINEIPF